MRMLPSIHGTEPFLLILLLFIFVFLDISFFFELYIFFSVSNLISRNYQPNPFQRHHIYNHD